MRARWAALILVASSALTVQPAVAAQPALPYEPGLLRLAELLGSLHFLRNLCGEKGDSWREQMDTLIAAEKPDDARKARLIASFNHGYRTFQLSYSQCTPAAVESINRYMREGEALSRDLHSRYGS